jgi:hypothetical protein
VSRRRGSGAGAQQGSEAVREEAGAVAGEVEELADEGARSRRSPHPPAGGAARSRLAAAGRSRRPRWHQRRRSRRGPAYSCRTTSTSGWCWCQAARTEGSTPSVTDSREARWSSPWVMPATARAAPVARWAPARAWRAPGRKARPAGVRWMPRGRRRLVSCRQVPPALPELPARTTPLVPRGAASCRACPAVRLPRGVARTAPPVLPPLRLAATSHRTPAAGLSPRHLPPARPAPALAAPARRRPSSRTR